MYKELVEYLVGYLVEAKDEISITEINDGDKLVLKLKVAPEDMGRVIGKDGRIIKSLREILRAYSGRENKKVILQVEG
ncbi:MAG: KH domain-containing protein [Clostridia bacterium]|nr:KH domain-containing protein [Clostridia bacterium]MDD4375401.1 KH domain-containing protein [Clostridia bacterium]